MPLFFLLVGVLLVVVGINNRVGDLVSLLKEDFVPSDKSTASFAVWIVVIGLLGVLANIKSIKPIANGFMVLVILVFLVTKTSDGKSVGQTFAEEFSSAIKSL